MKLTPTVRRLVLGFLSLSIPSVLALPASGQFGISISVRIGPPALPVYEQPLCPGPGYLWTPGYWAWEDDDGYYWVPGTWVVAPVGLLWTPGYWGWNDGLYVWNAGYWGPEIGFYGGINYGFGYGGSGFYGGEWRGGTFFYNTAVTRVNTATITNVYVNKTVIVANPSHVAFNGGTGGVVARPTAREQAYMHATHTPPIAAQNQQREAASHHRALFASTNHGRPTIAASAKPGQFSGKGVVAARAAGGTYQAPKMSPKQARASAPAANRPEAAKGETVRPEARSAERGSAGRAPAEKRPSEKATDRRAEPAEHNPANNAMDRSRRENENAHEKMAAHEHEKDSRPEKPTPSHAASQPPAEKARTQAHAENRPDSQPANRPETAPHPSTPAAEKSRLPNPHAENRPAPGPSAQPHGSAPKASAPRPSPGEKGAAKPEHNSAPAHNAAKPAAAPKPQKPENQPKERN